MQFDQNKSSIALILVIVLALGGLWYMQHQKKYPQADPLQNLPTMPQADLNVNPALQKKAYELEKKIEKEKAEKVNEKVTAEEQFEPIDIVNFGPQSFEDPVCLMGKMDFLALPSIFLKNFYKSDTSFIVLPQKYAKCIEQGKAYKFVFFYLNVEYQMPWFPLVTMEGMVDKVIKYEKYSDLKATNYDQNLAKVRFAEKEGSLSEFVEQHFKLNMAEPFVKIEIAKQKIEDLPSYWPNAPTIHAHAKYIDNNTILDWMKQNPDLIYAIDMRSNKHQDLFKLFFPTKSFAGKQVRPHNKIMSAAELNEFTKLSIDYSKRNEMKVVILGQGKEDYAPYNGATYFTLRQWPNVYILLDGVTALGAPSANSLTFPGNEITADELKAILKSDPRTTLVDCRDPAAGNNHLLIKGSEKIPFVNKTPPGSNANYYMPDGAQVIQNIKQKNISKVVLYGPNRVNEKTLDLAKQFIDQGISVSWLKNGFPSWYFHIDYKWDEPILDLMEIRQRGQTIRVEPPKRTEVNKNLATANGSDKDIVEGEDKSTAVKAQTAEEIAQEIKKRRIRAMKNRNRNNKQNNQPPAQSN